MEQLHHAGRRTELFHARCREVQCTVEPARGRGDPPGCPVEGDDDRRLHRQNSITLLGVGSISGSCSGITVAHPVLLVCVSGHTPPGIKISTMADWVQTVRDKKIAKSSSKRELSGRGECPLQRSEFGRGQHGLNAARRVDDQCHCLNVSP